MIKWRVSIQDARLIEKLTERAMNIGLQHDISIEPLALRMDITAVHANGCTLRLADLLHADEFDFSHDIFGIRRHLNRDTGKLENCFSPRFSAQ